MHADHPAALLWDFDGTLVDSEDSWARAQARLMAGWGMGWSEEDALGVVGQSNLETALVMLRMAGRDLAAAEEIAVLLNEYALEDMVEVGTPFRPGARELLLECVDAGVPCALVSATHTGVLTTVLADLPVEVFGAVVGGDQVARSKPEPDSYLVAAERLGVRAEDCLALEDSVAGSASAFAAGCVVLGIPYKLELQSGPRRPLVPTLVGLGLDDLVRLWREHRAA